MALIDVSGHRDPGLDSVGAAIGYAELKQRLRELLVAGDEAPVERAFGVEARDSVLDLPGVMSRRKQVAPKLLASA